MKVVLIVLGAVVLGLFGLRGLLFPHVYVYEYKFGTLGSSPAHFWAGPFTGATLGTYEHGGYPKPLPDIYVHWRDGFSVRLSALREDTFVRRFGRTYRMRYDGYASGRSGDIEVGFVDGKVKSLIYRYRQGWPCFSARTDSTRFCFPLSRSEARELFGPPWDIEVRDKAWH